MQTTALTFFALLFQGKPADAHVLVWRTPSKDSHWFTDIERAAAFATESPNSNVYVGVGLSGQDYGLHNRCPASTIAGLPGLFIDLDILNPAHKKKALPKTIEDALALLPKDFPPTAVVYTGHGAHAYWLFDKPWMFADPGERQAAAKLLREWQRIIIAYARACGLILDSTFDISRVLRVPGTMNVKDPANPVLATLVQSAGPRYTVAALQKYVTDVAMPPEIGPRLADAPITPVDVDVTSNGTLPPEALTELLNDGKFAAIWRHHRPELATQSEIDMALANYLIDGGFPDQTIADAIVHNRREFNANEPKGRRPDYIAKTLTKAKHKLQAKRPVVEIPANMPADPALRRAILLECLSAAIGQPVTDFTKLVGDEPLWKMYLNGGEDVITFVKAGQLLNFAFFRERCLACCEGKTPAPMKQAQWLPVFAMVDELIRPVEGGDESSEAALCASLLDTYLGERGCALSIEDLQVESNNVKSPFACDGQVALSSLDFAEFAKHQGELLSRHEVGTMLHAIGAKTRKFHMPGRTTQRRWMLPLEDWSVVKYREIAKQGRKEGKEKWMQ